MKTVREPARDVPVVRDVDVIVAGGGPTGIAAALAAARNGASTLLVEQQGYLGGNLVMWLPLFTFMDVQGNQIIKGIPQEFIDRLTARGGSSPHYPSILFNSYTIVDVEALKLVAQKMLLEAGVEILLHTFVAGLVVQDRHIDALVVESLHDGTDALLTVDVGLEDLLHDRDPLRVAQHERRMRRVVFARLRPILVHLDRAVREYLVVAATGEDVDAIEFVARRIDDQPVETVGRRTSCVVTLPRKRHETADGVRREVDQVLAGLGVFDPTDQEIDQSIPRLLHPLNEVHPLP